MSVASNVDSQRPAITTSQGGAAFAAPAYLVLMWQNGVAAQRLDPSRMTLSGETVTLSDRLSSADDRPSPRDLVVV